MILQQDGSNVSGPYGAEGWASIEGSVKGGRLTCTWKRIKARGSAWFEMTPAHLVTGIVTESEVLAPDAVSPVARRLEELSNWRKTNR